MKKSYLLKLMLLLAILSGSNVNVLAQALTFNYTGGLQNYTVPLGVTGVLIDAVGASGGVYSGYTNKQGSGGRITCNLAVSGGQVLVLAVGGKGDDGTSSSAQRNGGFNGGGSTYCCYPYSSGGGGASDVRVGGSNPSNRVVVAGGGGGAGYDCSSGNDGGHGGGLTGLTSSDCGNMSSFCYSATGGSQTGTGTNGTCGSNTAPSGGNGGWSYYGGGGGGGGYFGGGGGYFAGGGGGSSYPAASGGKVTNVVHTQGYMTLGNGYIIICPGPVAGTINGTNTVCPGGGTNALTNVGGVTGGVWGSSAVGIATVNATTGVVTGITPGTAIISYTVSSSCASSSATFLMTVLPSSTQYTVTGGGGYCAGGTGVSVGLPNSEANTSYYLMNGTTTVKGPLTNPGGPIDFSPVTTVGNLSVVAVSASTSCSLTMTGNAVVYTNPLPITTGRNVTGGGSYCVGPYTQHVGTNQSDVGTTYTRIRFNTKSDTLVSSSLTGNGGPLDFGADTGGTYTVLATNTYGCSVLIPGNAVIKANPLPKLHTVTGGLTQNYCPNTAGDTVGLSGSGFGKKYQLYRGTAPVGAALAGTNTPLFFGLQSVPGTYTVIATDTTFPTLCTSTMTSSSTIITASLPNTYVVSSTGLQGYCVNTASNISVQLNGGEAGVTYRLYKAPGVLASGTNTITGPNTDFFTHVFGNYTVVATNPQGCVVPMVGVGKVDSFLLPTVDTLVVAGGKSTYCAGGKGVHMQLKYSDVGITYQLLLNGGSHTTKPGANTTIDFDADTLAGAYTATATNNITGCKVNMSGTITVSINPLPAVHLMTGGGAYCEGGSGLPVTLDGSNTGIKYQLFHNGNVLGSPVSGTGSAITFGVQTDSNAYTAVATNNTTGCTNNMAGTSVIKVNPSPEGFLIHEDNGGVYCAGTTGIHIGLDNTAKDTVSYQLYNLGSPVGAGITTSGGYFDFPVTTVPGTYTVKATNLKTTCTAFMLGSANVNMNPMPNVYNVTGGGSYCAGAAGADIKLSFSNVGIDYQLMLGGSSPTPVGLKLNGTGTILDFGSQPTVGNYYVVAVNSLSGCTKSMSGSVPVTVSPLPPNQTVTIDNAGNYCLGKSGVHIGVGNSGLGISYQLYLGSVPVGAYKVGANKALDFGLKTTPGIYHVRATNATSGCGVDMTNTVTVNVNALPNEYAIGGGGSYCANGTGINILMTPASDANVDYTLYLNGTALPATLTSGNGSALDFGAMTGGGTYTIMAHDNNTGCDGPMSGTTAVNILPLPTKFNVTGGGAFCAGSTGKNVMLSGSEAGMTYQLFNAGPDGLGMLGSGKSLDFGTKTTAGIYTVVATNNATTCTDTMLANAPVVMNPVPAVDTLIGGGSFCVGTAGVSIDLKNSSNTVKYQLYNGVTSVGFPVLGTGGILSFGLTTAGGNYTVVGSDNTLPTHCSSLMQGVDVVTPVALVLPTVITKTANTTVCQGDTVSYTTVVTNGGTSPLYQWSVNGVPVVGETNATYSKVVPVHGDVVAVDLTSNVACPTTTTVTNGVTMTVNPKVSPYALIDITDPLSGPICPGTAVTYHAIVRSSAPVGPTYQWYNNGVPSGGASSVPYYVIAPNNGDKISVKVTPGDVCKTVADTTVSFTAVVIPVTVPTNVKLKSNGGTTLIAGKLDTISVTYDAASVGDPSFVWMINGVVVEGETTNRLVSADFASHDEITCTVTSTGACGGTSVSASMTILVRDATAVNQVTGNASDIRVMPNPNKGTFILKGTLANTIDETATIEITNMIGQVVYKNSVATHNGIINEQVQLNNTLANGMYILNVRSGSENTSFHFVMEQ